jgi:prophage tail gpP-like protein
MSATRRIALVVDGQVHDLWHTVAITRALSDLAGSFELELRDAPRHLATFPYATPVASDGPIRFGQKAELLIDGEMVLKGWIEDVHPFVSNGQVRLAVSGRDVTCDAVDCPADPAGKHEFLNVDLTEGARRTLKRFAGITVRADVDVGKPFPRWTIEAGETALSTIEKYARRRGVLVTSDGIGGLVLTRSGRERGADTLSLPGNVVSASGNFSARERFSHYFVKGGAERGGGGGAKTAALDARAAPAETAREAAGDQTGDNHAEAASALAMGEARDPEVGRWRPFVSMSRTQTNNTDARTYAEWLMRTRRGKSEQADYEVRDWRGRGGQLWRLNELVQVSDGFLLLERDMLIHGLSYIYDERGARTRLRVCGPEAYDRLPDGERRRNRPRPAVKRP